MSDSFHSIFKTSSAGYLTNHMARLFFYELAEAIYPLKLAPAQFMVLLEVWREEGQVQRDLVVRLDVEQATLTSTLNRMERDGLIVRRRHPEDNRASCIFLTERGRELEPLAIQAANDVNAKALQNLSVEEREQLLTLMLRVISTLRTHRVKPKPRQQRMRRALPTKI